MTLTEFREKKKMTMTALAEKLELTVAAVSYYEKGRVPRRDIIARIEEFTNGWVKAQDFY